MTDCSTRNYGPCHRDVELSGKLKRDLIGWVIVSAVVTGNAVWIGVVSEWAAVLAGFASGGCLALTVWAAWDYAQLRGYVGSARPGGRCL